MAVVTSIMRAFLCFALFSYFGVDVVRGGGCDTETGSETDPASLGGNEQPIGNTGLAVRLSNYSTTCMCGIITRWDFYTRRNGTVIFYALNGNTVVGKTSVSIPELSHDNYYQIPLSSAMWISVSSGNTLGLFTDCEIEFSCWRDRDCQLLKNGNPNGSPLIFYITPDLPMITYGSTPGYQYYSTTGQSEVAVGSDGSFGVLNLNREYAVRAYIETGHNPMFTNLPYTVSIYTHDVGIHIITVSATDLDPDDIAGLSMTASNNAPYFDFVANHLIYVNASQNSVTVTVTVTVSDGCLSTTDTITVELINEPPTLTNLPASVDLAEKGSGTSNIFTITTSDPAGDPVSCVLNTADAAITPYFSIAGNIVSVTYPATNGGFVHDTRPAYDLPIRCSDNDNNVDSVLNVDITKNEPPVYSSATGYLPATVQVGRDVTTIYTLIATDPEGDALTFSRADCSRGNCPITVAAGGVITPNQNLPGPNYDLTIEVTDGYNVVSKVLSVYVSEYLDFNSAPNFWNLPATIYVNENTPSNTQLIQFMYREWNTWDSTRTFTRIRVSDSSANTYFSLDDTTGTVYVLAPFDYDTVLPTTLWIDYRVWDGRNGNRENLTIVYANVNEAPVLSITTVSIMVDEGPRDTIFTDPGLGVTDPDSGDAANCVWSLDCGTDSKYFYIKDADRRVYLAREYDMDTGLTGLSTCVVSVIDPKGLSSTGTLSLTVNNINDHTPKFPYHRYLFLQSPDDAFFTKVENLTATDADSNQFGSTLGTITYSFDTTNYPQSTTYYQLDVNGILYVRDVSSFNRGDSYVFKLFAVDSGGRTGTTTISILFAEVETVTTTTTERNYTFDDDFGNYVWVFIVAILLSITLVIAAVMIWFDPVVHDFVAFKLMRIDELCRHKPKEPKRTAGKLTVTVNNKTLENDPDDALPWEMFAKDANVPEMNQVQEEITKRKEKQEHDYMKLTGRNVFEKGKGVRPATAEVEVHSSASGSRSSSSPHYDNFHDQPDSEADLNGQTNEGFDDSGSGGWDNGRASTPIVLVSPAPEQETNIDDDEDVPLTQ